MSHSHPGVEILATVIDNLKNADYLQIPDARFVHSTISLLFVWAIAMAFYFGVGGDRLTRLFGASQVILIMVSYGSINLSTTFINLTGPLTVGLAFFTISRFYASAVEKLLDHDMVRAAVDSERKQYGLLMLVNVASADGKLNAARLEKIRRGLRKVAKAENSVEFIKSEQHGIWGLLENTLALSWLIPEGDAAARAAVEEDMRLVLQSVPGLLERQGLARSSRVKTAVAEGPLAAALAARQSWQALLADALHQLAYDKAHSEP